MSIPVTELRLIRPIEVSWDGPPMPVICLRRPDKVTWDPQTRCVTVDTGRAVYIMPLDAESVERMVLGPQPANPTVPPKPTASPGSVLVRKKT